MRKAVLGSLLLLLSALPVLAQDDEDWRRRPVPPPEMRRYPSPHAFELTPFLGYRWGGTIAADQTFVFGEDVEVESSANFGINFGIPLGPTGLKLELMANHQTSELTTSDGLFEPEAEVADIDVTYFHAGLQIPFAASPHVVPFTVFSLGFTSLEPQVRGLDDEQRFSMSAAVGVKVPVSRVISFRFEGRGYYTFLDTDYDECDVCDYYYREDFYQGEVNAGLVFSF